MQGYLDTLEDRKNVKFSKGFLDWLRDDILKSHFPIKSVSQLTTLCTTWWVQKYQKAEENEKKQMIDDMKKLRDKSEKDGLLHNSREIKEGDEN